MFIADSGGSATPVTTAPAALPRADAPVDTGFAASAYGTKADWSLDTDLAELSSNVYHGEDKAIGDGDSAWSRVDADTLKEAGILDSPRDDNDVVLSDPDSGFKAAIYTDGTGRVVVAFAGSSLTSMDDWLTNGGQAVGFDTKQYTQAIALAEKAVEEFGEGNVVFTGHSLGGGLASAAALATNNPAVTFNSSGVGPNTYSDVQRWPSDAKAAASDGLIRRYNVENDPLTNAQQSLLVEVPGGASNPLPDAIGYEITLENPNGFEANPIAAHEVGTVVAAMKAEDIKSEQDDNFIEHLLSDNLFYGGPSPSDLAETGQDAARLFGIGARVAYGLTKDAVTDAYADGKDAVVDAYVDGRDAVVDAYDDTREAAGDAVDAGVGQLHDTYEAGRDLASGAVDAGEDFVEGAGDVVESMDPRNWDAPW